LDKKNYYFYVYTSPFVTSIFSINVFTIVTSSSARLKHRKIKFDPLLMGGVRKSHESGSLPGGVEGVTSRQFADQSLATVILQVNQQLVKLSH
jgi:hypothetical protein